MHQYGMSWTDDNAKEALENMIKETGISHFPTHKQLEDFYGDKGLTVYLSRNGGTRRWAEIFNLPTKACDNTVFGNKYELQAIEDIKRETGLDSKLTCERFPYDIYTGNGVKIDVKSSKPLRYRNFENWSFNLEKKIPTCDIYVFYCITFDEIVSKCVIIPSCCIDGIKQVGIGQLSKYDNYIERWDLIKEYGDFLSNIKKKIDLIPKRRTTK